MVPMATAKERAERSLTEATAKLNKAIGSLTGVSREGLLDAGTMLIEAAKLRVPREYGFLAANTFVRYAQNNPNRVEIGFSQHYAAYVHENLERTLAGRPRPSGLGVYWGPNGEPRFLANRLNQNHGPILEILQRRGARVIHGQ